MSLNIQERMPRVTSSSRGRQKRTGWTRYRGRTFYAFLSPWLFGFFGLMLLPLVYALVISFTNFAGVGHWHWLGLGNYSEALRDPDVLYSLGRTLLYTLLIVPLGVAGGLGLAVLVNGQMPAVGVFRALFYLPAIVPITAGALIWKVLFDRNTGAVNAIVEAFHLPPVTWLSDPYAFLVMVTLVLWGIGGGMVISLAGLQGIPAELHEAAAVDGSPAVQTFFRITLPLLSPVLFFQVITGVIGALQTLVQPLLLTTANGAVAASSVPHGNELYMVNVYAQFVVNQRLGYGSALLWILFAIVLAITLLVFRSSAFWVYYEIEQEKGE